MQQYLSNIYENIDFLGYGFLLNNDLHKISVLLVYDILRFENIDIWLTWDNDVMKDQNFSSNSKDINFQAIVL